MDIGAIKPAEALLEIVHPGTGKELQIRVSLCSIDDERLKRVKRQIQNEQINLSKRGKQFDADKVEANENLLLFTAMTGWEWYGENNFHDAKPPFNQDNVNKVFAELPWFKDQVRDKVAETKDFFQT